MPENKDKYGLDNRIGTGRFAKEFSIDCGLEPSKKWLNWLKREGYLPGSGKPRTCLLIVIPSIMQL